MQPTKSTSVFSMAGQFASREVRNKKDLQVHQQRNHLDQDQVLQQSVRVDLHALQKRKENTVSASSLFSNSKQNNTNSKTQEVIASPKGLKMAKKPAAKKSPQNQVQNIDIQESSPSAKITTTHNVVTLAEIRAKDMSGQISLKITNTNSNAIPTTRYNNNQNQAIQSYGQNLVIDNLDSDRQTHEYIQTENLSPAIFAQHQPVQFQGESSSADKNKTSSTIAKLTLLNKTADQMAHHQHGEYENQSQIANELIPSFSARKKSGDVLLSDEKIIEKSGNDNEIDQQCLIKGQKLQRHSRRTNTQDYSNVDLANILHGKSGIITVTDPPATQRQPQAHKTSSQSPKILQSKQIVILNKQKHSQGSVQILRESVKNKLLQPRTGSATSNENDPVTLASDHNQRLEPMLAQQQQQRLTTESERGGDHINFKLEAKIPRTPKMAMILKVDQKEDAEQENKMMSHQQQYTSPRDITKLNNHKEQLRRSSAIAQAAQAISNYKSASGKSASKSNKPELSSQKSIKNKAMHNSSSQTTLTQRQQQVSNTATKKSQKHQSSKKHHHHKKRQSTLFGGQQILGNEKMDSEKIIIDDVDQIWQDATINISNTLQPPQQPQQISIVQNALANQTPKQSSVFNPYQSSRKQIKFEKLHILSTTDGKKSEVHSTLNKQKTSTQQANTPSLRQSVSQKQIRAQKDNDTMLIEQGSQINLEPSTWEIQGVKKQESLGLSLLSSKHKKSANDPRLIESSWQLSHLDQISYIEGTPQQQNQRIQKTTSQLQEAEYHQRLLWHKNSQKRHLLTEETLRRQPNQRHDRNAQYNVVNVSKKLRRATSKLSIHQTRQTRTNPGGKQYSLVARSDYNGDDAGGKKSNRSRLSGQQKTYIKLMKEQHSMWDMMPSEVHFDTEIPYYDNNIGDHQNPRGISRTHASQNNLSDQATNSHIQNHHSSFDMNKIRIIVSERKNQDKHQQLSSRQNHIVSRLNSVEVKSADSQTNNFDLSQRIFDASLKRTDLQPLLKNDTSIQQIVRQVPSAISIIDEPQWSQHSICSQGNLTTEHGMSIIIGGGPTKQSQRTTKVIEQTENDQLQQQLHIVDAEQPKEQEQGWQEYLRDEFSLIKCHKNAFGSKGYNLSSDKSALTHHVNKILKLNLDKATPALPKPYLIKYQSISQLPQDQQNLRPVESIKGKIAFTSLQKNQIIANPTTKLVHENAIISQSVGQSQSALQLQKIEKQPNIMISSKDGSDSQRIISHKNVIVRGSQERSYGQLSRRYGADKLNSMLAVRSRDYKTRGSQYRSRLEPLETQSSALAFQHDSTAKINPTTIAQWQRNCSPEAIQAQIYKLQALKINKLNIDYKIVDRTSDDRPFCVSEDESDCDGQFSSNRKQQNQDLAGQYQLCDKIADQTDSAEQQQQQANVVASLPEKAISRQSFASQINLEEFDINGDDDTATQGYKDDKIRHDSVDQVRNLRQLNHHQSQHINNSSIGAGASGTRDRLPISPAASYLKQAPSDHHLKLSSLMKKVVSVDSNQSLDGTENFSVLGANSYNKNGGRYSLRKLKNNNMRDSKSIDSTSNPRIGSTSSLGGSNQPMLLLTSDVVQKTRQAPKADTKAPDLDSFLGLYRAPMNVGTKQKVKNSFRNYAKKTANTAGNNHRQFLKKQILKDDNLGIKMAQFEKSTQLVRDASVKFITTTNNDCSSPINVQAFEPRKEYDSIKIVNRPKRNRNHVLLKPASSVGTSTTVFSTYVNTRQNAIQTQQDQHVLASSGSSRYQILRGSRQFSSDADCLVPMPVQSTNNNDNVDNVETAKHLSQNHHRHHMLSRRRNQEYLTSQSNTKLKTQQNKREIHGQQSPVHFDPIKQKHFTPGPELIQQDQHAQQVQQQQSKVGMKSSTASSRYQTMQKQSTKQVAKAYFPRLT